MTAPSTAPYFTLSSDANFADTTGQAYFTYEDWRGNTWNTRAITVSDINANTLQEAFESLPNNAVPQVDVTVSGNDFRLTFPKGSIASPITAHTMACTDHGCQPISAGTTEALAINPSSGSSDNEYVTCSNRGSCDSGTGLCVCESGYYGEDCSKQTTIR